jgi:putative transposase
VSYPVTMMCRVLGVSPSGYYAWRDRPPSRRCLRDWELGDRIQAIHVSSRGVYGVPRIHAELREDGVRIGSKRVARLMRARGLEGVSRRKSVRTTRQGKSPRAVPDLVERDFTADGPDQLWVADITYIPTWSGFLYLAVVLDAWSRRIVGWSMRGHLRTELVLEALEMALWNRSPDAVIHHSDQGTQYTSIAFGLRCKRAGVRPSMGSAGDCFDNALCESFFASLECELLDRTSLRTHTQARLAIFDYIESFYNRQRRHSYVGYLSPVTFENRAHQAALATRSLRDLGVESPSETKAGRTLAAV